MSPVRALAHDLRELSAQAAVLADLVQQTQHCDRDTVAAASQAVASAQLMLNEIADQIGCAADPAELAAA